MREENGVRREEAGKCLRALVVNSHRVLSLLSPLSAYVKQIVSLSLSLCFALKSQPKLDWTFELESGCAAVTHKSLHATARSAHAHLPARRHCSKRARAPASVRP